MKHSLIIGSIFLLNYISNIPAQVITDGSLGQVHTLVGPDYVIAEEVGSRVGNNLFHSFYSFDLNSQNGVTESATFKGSSDIKNVISRVTGGKISIINGLIKSEIGHADFYFFNPAGLWFGAQAQVDVPAAFHVSTADQLRFSDNTVFSASSPEISTLGMVQPEAFGFFAPQPFSLIVNGSQLNFSPGSTVSFSGADILISGSTDEAAALINEGGRIQLGAIGDSQGELKMDTFSTFPLSGNIRIENSKISVAGAPPGTLEIQGGSLVVDNNSNLTARADGGSGALSNGIFVYMTGEVLVDHDSRLSANNVGGMGSGPDMSISAQNITIQGGAILDSRTAGTGLPGDISLLASDTLLISGKGEEQNSQILKHNGLILQSDRAEVSALGKVDIDAGELIVLDGAFISSRTLDFGVAVDEENILNHPNILDLSVERLTIASGGNIVVYNKGSSDIGNIAIDVSGDMLLDGEHSSIVSGVGSGRGADIGIRVGGLLSMQNGATIRIGSPPGMAESGIGGNLNIHAGAIQFNDGAHIYASNERFSTAKLGDVVMSADTSILFDGSRSDELGYPISSGIYSQLYGNGEVGRISVHSEQLSLLSGGSITAQNYSIDPNSRGADIDIEVENLEITSAASDALDLTALSGSSQIVSGTGHDGFFPNDSNVGNGGQIKIEASGEVIVNGNDNFFGATIRNSSNSGVAGGIEISAKHLSLLNNAQIRSETNSGQAADIIMDVSRLDFQGGEITTSTAGGNQAGDIFIQAAEAIEISGNFESDSWQSQVAQIDSLTTGPGNAGKISMSTPQLVVGKGGVITTDSSGTGNAGIIQISSEQLLIENGGDIVSTAHADGNAGEIYIESERIRIAGSSSIIASSTAGEGDAGFISINTEQLVVDAQNSERFTGITNQATSESSGAAGDINLVAGQIQLKNGAAVSIANKGNLSEHKLLGFSPGKIAITTDELAILDGSFISARATGNAPASDIVLTIDKQLRIADYLSQIVTAANTNNGGNISITGPGAIILQDGLVTTSTLAGDGGDIVINTDVLAMDGGFIQANTALGASGGDIDINVPYMLTANARQPEVGALEREIYLAGSGRNVIQAAAPEGNPGTLSLSFPDLDSNASLVQLSTNYMQPASISGDPCAKGNSDNDSSLIAAGRGGVPVSYKNYSSVAFASDRLELLLDNRLKSGKKYNSLNKESAFADRDENDKSRLGCQRLELN